MWDVLLAEELLDGGFLVSRRVALISSMVAKADGGQLLLERVEGVWTRCRRRLCSLLWRGKGVRLFRTRSQSRERRSTLDAAAALCAGGGRGVRMEAARRRDGLGM